jgi:hypothetical protein
VSVWVGFGKYSYKTGGTNESAERSRLGYERTGA